MNKLFFTERYWGLYKVNIWSFTFILEVLKWLGLVWLIVEPATYFFEDQVETYIKPYGKEIFAVAVLLSIFRLKPRLSFKYKVNGKDVNIKIKIGDLFKFDKQHLIIPSNKHFITKISDTLIDETSIQGQYLNKYFKGKHESLDKKINEKLGDSGIKLNELHHNKEFEYPLGTTCIVHSNKKKWCFFNKKVKALLFAIAGIDEQGVCQSDIGEYQSTLPKLWNYLGNNPSGIKDYVLPIIGSGNCRIDATKEDLFKEIIQSFLVALTDKKSCKSLTIVLYYKDVADGFIDIDELNKFTEFHTSSFGKQAYKGEKTGTSIS